MSTPPDTCPYGLCDGDGFVVDEVTRVAEPCRCRPQRIERRRARSLSAVIPRRYRGVSFDRPPVSDMPHPQVMAVKSFVRRLDERLDAGRGLWFAGTVGTGKTTLAMLVSRAALDAGRSVAIYSVPRLLSEIRGTYEADTEGTYVDFLDRLAAVDLLHLDDLGSERRNEWVLEQLYAVINARYEEQRSVVITCNVKDDDPEARIRELEEEIGERTISRLKEMCDIVPLFGADGRAPFREDARHSIA
jgi:DNA replication protein DnaC